MSDAEDSKNKGGAVSKDQFVVVDGVKICKITADGRLSFHDRNRRRSERRGTSTVVISADQLKSLANTKIATPKKDPDTTKQDSNKTNA